MLQHLSNVTAGRFAAVANNLPRPASEVLRMRLNVAPHAAQTWAQAAQAVKLLPPQLQF